MSKRAKILTAALVLVGVLAASLGGIALAADPDTPEEGWVCPGLGGAYGRGAGNLEAVSDLLGITPEEIHDQLVTGKSLAEIATDQGVSEDKLVAAIMAARTEFLQEKVTAGILTQEQATQRLELMAEQVREAVNRTTAGPPEWRGSNGCGAAGIGPGAMMRGRSQNGTNPANGSTGFRMGPGMMGGRGGNFR